MAAYTTQIPRKLGVFLTVCIKVKGVTCLHLEYSSGIFPNIFIAKAGIAGFATDREEHLP
jgi:hypothetical protein